MRKLYTNLKSTVALSVILYFCFAIIPLQAQVNAYEQNGLSVISYNLSSHSSDWPDDLPDVADMILDLDADIVLLTGVDVGTDRTDGTDVMGWLADATDMEPLFGELHAPSNGLSGNGILTSLEITGYDNMHYDQPADREQRGLLYAMLEYEDGHPLLAMVTLFDHASEENQQAAVDQIFELMSEFDGVPTIFAAGLQDAEESVQHEAMQTIFVDAWDEVGEGDGYNWSTSDPRDRNSYILYRNIEDSGIEIIPEEMFLPDVSVSSHRPIFASFNVDISEATSTEVLDRPEQISLEQNYPNPFNPATTIQYRLPASAHVTLEVFNSLGQKITTLVNEQQSNGQHSVTFDASNLTSGFYIYRLQAGDYTQTRNMILVK